MTLERRWIVLAEDGRHVTLGRATDPTATEIEAAGTRLQEIGLGGRLAVMQGRYHDPAGDVKLLQVRQLSAARVTWGRAEAAFKDIRTRSLAHG